MTETAKQLTLALFEVPRVDFADYFLGANHEAAAAAESWADDRGHWCLGLWGEPGVGKTHLLHAAVRRAHVNGKAAMYLPLREIAAGDPALLEGLESVAVLAIDDCDVIVQIPAWEEAMFVLYNRVAAAGGRLALAMRRAPATTDFYLPDLKSRFTAGLNYNLIDLNDADKQSALCAIANRRGITLSPSVANYLLSRLPRSMHALVDAVAILDRASLSAARHVTIPFVREVLGLS